MDSWDKTSTPSGSKIQTSRGKFLPLRNLWHHLHMFLNILELKIENKNVNLGKTVLIMWSQICGSATYLFTKLLLKSGKKTKTKKHWQSLADSWDKTSTPIGFLWLDLQNRFPWRHWSNFTNSYRHFSTNLRPYYQNSYF